MVAIIIVRACGGNSRRLKTKIKNQKPINEKMKEKKTRNLWFSFEIEKRGRVC
jgi:hypothetical protein